MANKKLTKEEQYLLQDEERPTSNKDVIKAKEEEIRSINDQINGIKKHIRGKEEEIRAKSEQINAIKDMIRILNQNESIVVSHNELLYLVKNSDKINLSESEIMSILKKTQNPIMKKSELMETIEKKLIFEANMDDSVRDSFESGRNDYSEILDSNLTNQLAQNYFREIAQKIREKTGKQNVTLDDVQSLLMRSLIDAAKKEYAYGIERLEQKAVEMVSRKFKIPSGAIEFEVSITGLPVQMAPMVLNTANVRGFNREQMMIINRVARNPNPTQQDLSQLSQLLGVKFGNINKEGLKMTKGNIPPPQGKTEEELKPKVKRRRFTNAMMQGSARKTQNLHFEDEQFREENPELSQQYGNIMAANDASYWMMSDETIKQQGQSGIHAGNSRIKISPTGGPPKIVAQGMTYPILLHELGKAIPELVALWSLPEDRAVKQYVLDKTDNLEAETNDIRLGPVLWDKFVRQIPVDNQEVISLTWHMLQELSDHEFNSIVEGLLRDSTNAQQKIQRLAEEALAELREEASDDEFGGYEDSPEQDDDGDVLTPPEDEGRGEPQPKEPSGPDYENMSRRDLELAIDDALDAGDMDLVKYLGSILNSKR
jgi:hypothetical protein